MTTEVIRYKIPASQAEAFERAYQQTEPVLQQSRHCLGYRLLRGVEEPQNSILLLHWDSLEGHDQGFRKEKEFSEFFNLVRPFLNQVQEMKHYDETKMVWHKAS